MNWCEKHGEYTGTCYWCENERLQAERDKLIEGLRWYADEDTHMIKRRSDGDYAPIALDHGKRARDILKEIGVTVE